MDFGWAQVPGESSWRTGGKSKGKNLPRNPLHNLLENLLNTWSVLTVFIDLILGTKKIKERRTPTGLGNSYWDPADRGDFGTHWVVAPARAQLHPVPLACSWWGSRKQEMKDCKGINILLGICPSSHRSKDLLESETELRELSAEFVFRCPSFQHAGLLVTSPALGFLCVQLPPCELSLSWAPAWWGPAEVVSARLNPNDGTIDVGGVCNFLGSVTSRQKFEATEQCYSPQMDQW